jgi:hypothetical protein
VNGTMAIEVGVGPGGRSESPDVRKSQRENESLKLFISNRHFPVNAQKIIPLAVIILLVAFQLFISTNLGGGALVVEETHPRDTSMIQTARPKDEEERVLEETKVQPEKPSKTNKHQKKASETQSTGSSKDYVGLHTKKASETQSTGSSKDYVGVHTKTASKTQSTGSSALKPQELPEQASAMQDQFRTHMVKAFESHSERKKRLRKKSQADTDPQSKGATLKEDQLLKPPRDLALETTKGKEVLPKAVKVEPPTAAKEDSLKTRKRKEPSESVKEESPKPVKEKPKTAESPRREKKQVEPAAVQILTIQEEPRALFAYVYVVSGCDPTDPVYRSYLYAIMIATRILRSVGSTSDVVVLIGMKRRRGQTPTDLPDEDIEMLMAMKIRPIYIPASYDTRFYQKRLEKFLVFGLTEYKRVLYMDPDVLPLANLDYLMELSVMGVLRQNVILVGSREPAIGAFFMARPFKNALNQINVVIEKRRKSGEQYGEPFFDPVKGWGRGIEQSDPWENSQGTRGTNWTFFAGYADQGLLYHWTKYHMKSVSILKHDKIENWGWGRDGNVTLVNVIDSDEAFAGAKPPMFPNNPGRHPFCGAYNSRNSLLLICV